MADEMERIEKALEGNGLALSAVAEVLHKMDARLAKAEEDEDKKREDEEVEEAAVEKAALVKELATEVANMLKADQGLDVSGKERKAKTTGGSAGSADDSESAANITSKIDQQQNTIQAMRKEEDEKDEERWRCSLSLEVVCDHNLIWRFVSPLSLSFSGGGPNHRR